MGHSTTILLVVMVTAVTFTHASYYEDNDALFREMLAQMEDANEQAKQYGDEISYDPYAPYVEDEDKYERNYAPYAGDVYTAPVLTDPQVVKSENDHQAGDDPRSTDIRDQEKEHQNMLWGYQYVSGGAGEGKQHLVGNLDNSMKQEVKTDAALPAYCNPPNPCPKGKTAAKDNCQENIPDTGAFNQRFNEWQQKSGACKCDNEHMFNCPDGATVSSKKTSNDAYDNNDLDALVKSLLGENTKTREEEKNPFSQGSKRDSLVPKKHLYKREAETDMIYKNIKFPEADILGKENSGLRVVAKKSPPQF